MSGPKVSIYTLTGAARRIVNEQFRCEQETLLYANQIKQMLTAFGTVENGLSRSAEALELLQRKFGVGAEETQRIQAFKASFSDRVRALEQEFSLCTPIISSRYIITEAALEQKQRILARIKKLKERVQELKAEADSCVAAGKTIGEREQRRTQSIIINYMSESDSHKTPQQMSEQDIQRLRQSISEDIATSTLFDVDADAPAIDTEELHDKKEDLNKKLSELLHEDLPKEIEDAIRSARLRLQRIKTKDYLDAFNAVTMPHVLELVEKHRLSIQTQQQTFNELLARYHTLCEMASIEPKPFSFSGDAIKCLSDEITLLEKALIRQSEQAYICDSINEVMAEMGYDIIGYRDVTKRNGKRFRNELYRFNEGTAVNVTISPEGQIAMELGGVARQDRLPTDEETEILTRDMESFCGEFSEFERRMKEKGIIVGSRIALAPPTHEYATIINVSDYEITNGAHAAEINARKKKTTPEKRVIRRDE